MYCMVINLLPTIKIFFKYLIAVCSFFFFNTGFYSNFYSSGALNFQMLVCQSFIFDSVVMSVINICAFKVK